jgi:hypothetical protein
LSSITHPTALTLYRAELELPPMSDELYPSGPWIGFYNYFDTPQRHRMDLHLTFSQGRMTGEGNDDIGPFIIEGKYDAATNECHWTKQYVGRHSVFYRGFREGRGIWGTWELRVYRGGFHIWPLNSGTGDEIAEPKEEEKPVDAVARETVHSQT